MKQKHPRYERCHLVCVTPIVSYQVMPIISQEEISAVGKVNVQTLLWSPPPLNTGQMVGYIENMLFFFAMQL